MELLIIISSILRRYHFVLEQPEKRVRIGHSRSMRAADALFLHSSTRRRDSCVSPWSAGLALSVGAYK